jgi:hypothetical protein
LIPKLLILWLQLQIPHLMSHSFPGYRYYCCQVDYCCIGFPFSLT